MQLSFISEGKKSELFSEFPPKQAGKKRNRCHDFMDDERISENEGATEATFLSASLEFSQCRECGQMKKDRACRKMSAVCRAMEVLICLKNNSN